MLGWVFCVAVGPSRTNHPTRPPTTFPTFLLQLTTPQFDVTTAVPVSAWPNLQRIAIDHARLNLPAFLGALAAAPCASHLHGMEPHSWFETRICFLFTEWSERDSMFCDGWRCAVDVDVGPSPLFHSFPINGSPVMHVSLRPDRLLDSSRLPCPP